MKIDQETINQLLEEAKPSMIEGLKKELSHSIDYEMRQKIIEDVRKHVQTWVQENIIPEINKQLIESKEGLISIAPKMAETLVRELAKGFTEQVKSKLEKSWDRKKIFTALLD